MGAAPDIHPLSPLTYVVDDLVEAGDVVADHQEVGRGIVVGGN
jgi:hypothetical protein